MSVLRASEGRHKGTPPLWPPTFTLQQYYSLVLGPAEYGELQLSAAALLDFRGYVSTAFDGPELPRARKSRIAKP